MFSHTPIVVITGGAKRIGKAIALELANAGCDIVIHYNASVDDAHATCDAIQKIGRTAHAIRCDQRNVNDIARAVRETIAITGSIDLFVNNAAIFYMTPFGTIDENQWDDLLTTNLKGPFFYAQAIAPHIREGGSIINIADIYGNAPAARYLPYGISKAGIIAMTKGLSKVLAPKIRVNCICPGEMDEPKDLSPDDRKEFFGNVPMARIGKHSDVAKAVAYLADSDYITGEIHTVAGGKRLI